MYFSAKTNLMNRFLCSVLLLVSVCALRAQNTYTDSPGRWRLGLNMGAIWESSDVMPIPGLGGGFNIEKILNKRANAPIGFSLGFRYLGGRTYGMNTAPTWNLQDNKALNGSFDPNVRYDSVPGYFYANHKTFIQEGALEFKINFPRFEQNTHLILHFWGGIGIGKYKTWIDAKDRDGNMYDFSSTKGQTMSQSDLSRIFDGSYETLAEGSGVNGTLRVIPSAGIGFGVRLSRWVAIVLEHKVSFPMTDMLDGYKYAGACVNDFYHYTAANLIFTFHARGSSSSSSTHTHTDQTVYSNTTGTTVTTNTTTAVTNTTVTPTGTATVANVPKVYPPSVAITYPHNNFYSQYDNVSVSAQLNNITSSQQISITLNGYPLTHFSFNPSNDVLNFQSFLALGNNYFIVTATNSAGSASDQVNVIYAPTATVAPPTGTVTNTNPTTTVTGHGDTHTVTPTNTTTVGTPTVTTTNTVVSTTHTVVPTNTVTVHPPTTVPTTSTVTTPTVINTATTTPTNTVLTQGTGIPQHTVSPTGTVTTNAGAGQPPVVSFISPATNPYDESTTSYNVSASVLHIDNANQLSVTLNNNPVTQFNFSASTKTVSFLAPLQAGANIIVVKATNNFGTDSKTTVIKHRVVKPPVIVISFPASSPFNTFNQNETVNGFVYNVQAASQIKVTVNGNSSAFNFNPADNSLLVNVPNLLQGATAVNITANNMDGSDAKSVTFNYQSSDQNMGQGAGTGTTTTGPHRKPHITMMSPMNDPFYTNNNSASVLAHVNYINSASDVTVTYNGATVPSNFNPTTIELSFSSPLMQGMNTFVITATNAYGVTSQPVNISYTPVQNNGGGMNVPNNGGGGIIKPNSGGGIIQPKINSAPGGGINPGRPPVNNSVPNENKGDIKGGQLQQPNNPPPNNNTPRGINTGGGGRTFGGGGGR